LSDTAQATEDTKLFTSNLSVKELALCASIGVRALGQVMGSTVYQIGWQSPPFASGELTFVTKAYLQARQLVFQSMQQEAGLLGAHGIIGLQMERRELNPQRGLIEWKAFGTAVTYAGRQVAAPPFLSALTGQELWALSQAGYEPVGLAYGVCGYYQKGDCRFRNAFTRRSNLAYPVQSEAYSTAQSREDAGLTAGIYAARAHAMRRLENEAAQASASGIVGVHWEMKKHLREADYLNETFRKDVCLSVDVFGTAIVSVGVRSADTDFCLPLNH